MERMDIINKIINKIENLDFIENLKFKIENLANIMSDSILQVLKLSKLSVNGRAMKSGMERTNNTVASSSDAKSV